MKLSFTKYMFAALLMGVLSSVGCTPTTPTAPEDGSVQAYLDANPDAAARLTEGDDSEEEAEDDGTGE